MENMDKTNRNILVILPFNVLNMADTKVIFERAQWGRVENRLLIR
jgi:hypothetical protein